MLISDVTWVQSGLWYLCTSEAMSDSDHDRLSLQCELKCIIKAAHGQCSRCPMTSHSLLFFDNFFSVMRLKRTHSSLKSHYRNICSANGWLFMVCHDVFVCVWYMSSWVYLLPSTSKFDHILSERCLCFVDVMYVYGYCIHTYVYVGWITYDIRSGYFVSTAVGREKGSHQPD